MRTPRYSQPLPCLPLDRIWGHGVRTPTGCLEWTLSRLAAGYGRTSLRGAGLHVHRVAWELTYGPVPSGLQVLHHCDNPPCFEPTHLFLGTTQDNTADKMAKGRWSGNSGERNPALKLTAAQVQEVRRRRSRGELLRVLAQEFGVSTPHIHHIVSGKRRRLAVLGKE